MEQEIWDEARDILMKVYGFCPYEDLEWVYNELSDGKSRDGIIHRLDPTTYLPAEIA